MTYKSITAASIAALLLGASGAMAETWRYAFEEALEEVQGKFAQKFKEEVEANSDHEIQLFPFGTLGESADTMEQAQSGILQFVDQSPGFTGALIPEAQVFFVPYLLPADQDQLVEFFRTSKTIKELFPPLYADQGLELLTMFPEGEVMMTTTEAVETPEDLNEVKFRVMTNPLLVSSYQAFGATPTPLPWGEVYGALQTGIIQGQENPAFFIESTKMYEVTDHITRAGHNNFTTAVMANKEFYDGLPDEDKEVIQNAIDAAFDYIVEYQTGLTEESLAKIMEAKPDMTITELTEEQREPFKATAEAVEQEFLEVGGDQAQEILDQMKADLAAVSEGGGEAAEGEAATEDGSTAEGEAAADEAAMETADEAEEAAEGEETGN
ncbi:TRAP transporter substrate-binding protein [Paracoccus saliphilus]|uniref:TRAP transporter substrate-binding protein DctP n=1 Tax=Paracoccus saliphilus TaxID=405559 RepID=A0AA45W306_9RHOB|nr:TRAP transporter substrate-binding protein DctP [Paracoccus saliphilus]WCR04979.1 TRAP transporter substrate-binding protein DctP [Paracoccus saliphilus]SIS71766.1 TRAP-type C4-dicarboxylate transport system, substrate-binding protein [Paracoccus saliphilus]